MAEGQDEELTAHATGVSPALRAQYCVACEGRGGSWREVYVIDGWSVAWDDCPCCRWLNLPSPTPEAPESKEGE
jgi:hypothetical protein